MAKLVANTEKETPSRKVTYCNYRKPCLSMTMGEHCKFLTFRQVTSYPYLMIAQCTIQETYM